MSEPGARKILGAVVGDPTELLVVAAEPAREVEPQASRAGSNESVLSGIATSAIQPSPSCRAAASQMPSQSQFWRSTSSEEPLASHAVRVDVEDVARAALVVRVERDRETILSERDVVPAEHLGA